MVLISAGARAAGPAGATKEKGGDVSPTEDLMREHGILRRVLLVYDEAARRLATEDAIAMGVVAAAANIVHRFVEGYHEKLEEEFVFPKLEKAGKLVDLTKVLRVQHAAGRKLPEAMIKGAKPVYREQLTEAEFDKLGDRFEDQEHKLLGNGGFEGSLGRSATSRRRWVSTTSPSSRHGDRHATAGILEEAPQHDRARTGAFRPADRGLGVSVRGDPEVSLSRRVAPHY